MLPPLILWLAGYVVCGWWSGEDPGARACPRHRPADGHVSHRRMVSRRICTSISYSDRPVAGCGVVHDAGSHEPGREPPRMDSLAAGRLGCPAGLRLHPTPTRVRSLAIARRATPLIGAHRGPVGDARRGLRGRVLEGGSGRSALDSTDDMPPSRAHCSVWSMSPGSSTGRRRLDRAIHIGLFGLVCLGIPDQLHSAVEIGKERRTLYLVIERGLKTGRPISRLVNRACPALFPDRAKTFEYFRMLKEARVGEFEHLTDDLAVSPESGTVVR